MKDESREMGEVADKLRRERELSDKIVNNSTDVMFAFGRDRLITLWNTTAERVTGTSKTQAWNRSLDAVPWVVELTGNAEAYDRVLRGDTIRLAERAIFIKDLGVEAVLDVLITPLRDATGAVEGGLAVVHDITRYKRATEALVAKEILLREAQRLAHVGSWSLDLKGNKARWSDEMFRIAGREPQADLTFDAMLEMVHEADRSHMTRDLNCVAGTLAGITSECRVQRPDGTERIVECRVEPVCGPDNEVRELRGTWLDVTERRQREDQLRDAYDQLDKTLAELRTAQDQVIQTEKIVALGTMAAGIAHELNNPLMGIMSYVGYARRSPTAPRVDEFLGRAEQELARMRDLIKSMLSFARPTEGELTEVFVPQLLHHALELLGADLKARGIEVRTEMEEGLPPVKGKGSQLEQALLNLLLNARDAVTGRPEKRITVDGWTADDHVCIEVCDTGSGIPDAIRNRIFDPFFTTKPPGEGTGLGLSVSRTVVADMGGELSLVSSEGEGARFRVSLKKSQGETRP